MAPTGHQIFPDPRFDEQYLVLKILAGTDVQVPAVHWHEPDPAVLGAPFYVMTWVDGQAPPDVPPYHTGGWVTEVSGRPGSRSGGRAWTCWRSCTGSTWTRSGSGS